MWVGGASRNTSRLPAVEDGHPTQHSHTTLTASDARPTSSYPQALIGEGNTSDTLGLAHGRNLKQLVDLTDLLTLSIADLDLLKALTGVLNVVGDLLTIDGDMSVTGSTSLASVTVGDLAQIQLLNVAGESNLGKVRDTRGARRGCLLTQEALGVDAC